MTVLRMRSLTGLALVAVGSLAGSTVAHAATTELRIVSAVAHYDPSSGAVEPNTGWDVRVSGAGRAEISSAYGAPAGLGHGALMLDTPNAGDSVGVYARTDQGELIGAFPEMLRVAPDQRLGFWLYRSSASTSTAGPALRAYVGNMSMFNAAYITFDPVANGHTGLDTWIYVDATAGDATWIVTDPDGNFPMSMTWQEVSEHLSMNVAGVVNWATFQHGLTLQQNTAGSYSAIDGVSASANEWSSVTDFELQPTSGRPSLDSCKNDGWRHNYPTVSFKNQGACIAALVAAH